MISIKQPYKNWSNELSKIYTYDQWFEKYKPIKNTLTGYGELHFETYGAEAEFVFSQPDENVWTEVDGDEGCYIISGTHYVNRIHYYVTEVPWEDSNTEVPTWVYRMCDCVSEGDASIDCNECGGDGTIDVPCDTVEDLKTIYGDDVVANV